MDAEECTRTPLVRQPSPTKYANPHPQSADSRHGFISCFLFFFLGGWGFGAGFFGGRLSRRHALSQYYNGLVQLYADWGVDLIKWDCMYENSHIDVDPRASYGSEEQLAVNAVKAVDREMVCRAPPSSVGLPSI